MRLIVGDAGAVGAERGGVVVDRLAVDVAEPLAAQVGDDPLVEQVGVGRERAGAEVCDGVGVPPLDEELFERRTGADHLGGELAELSCTAERRLEELGVLAAVEGALPSSRCRGRCRTSGRRRRRGRLYA